MVLCFHNPNETNGYLSNWYKSSFVIEDITFSSIEQYMMHRKAVLFGDTEIAGRILGTDNPAKIKALGREVKNYNDTIWSGMRQIIVFEGLYAKFEQNSKLRGMLLSTEDAILAECAMNDKIWGIGLSIYDKRRFEMSEWKGQNLLGFSLMCIRDLF